MALTALHCALKNLIAELLSAVCRSRRSVRGSKDSSASLAATEPRVPGVGHKLPQEGPERSRRQLLASMTWPVGWKRSYHFSEALAFFLGSFPAAAAALVLVVFAVFIVAAATRAFVVSLPAASLFETCFFALPGSLGADAFAFFIAARQTPPESPTIFTCPWSKELSLAAPACRRSPARRTLMSNQERSPEWP